MKYIVGLPYRIKQFRDEFMSTCKLENIFEIDNTKNNIGFPASHNLGMQQMYEQDADWYIMASTAIRFGESGGLDFIEALEKSDSLVVEAQGVFGWHLIAFHRKVIDAVGFTDTNFTPYGYDDLDYSLRIQKAAKTSENFKNTLSIPWTKVSVDVKETMMGHSIILGAIPTEDEVLRDYYFKKWGRMPGTGEVPENTYEYPFNDSKNNLKYFTDDYFNSWKSRYVDNHIYHPITVICKKCQNKFTVMGAENKDEIEINHCAKCADPIRIRNGINDD